MDSSLQVIWITFISGQEHEKNVPNDANSITKTPETESATCRGHSFIFFALLFRLQEFLFSWHDKSCNWYDLPSIIINTKKKTPEKEGFWFIKRILSMRVKFEKKKNISGEKKRRIHSASQQFRIQSMSNVIEIDPWPKKEIIFGNFTFDFRFHILNGISLQNSPNPNVSIFCEQFRFSTH